MNRLRMGAVVIVCSLLLVSAAQAQSSGTKAPPTGSGSKVAPAGSGTKVAPPGSGTKTASLRIQNLEGVSKSFDELTENKPALLIFWASWCPQCQARAASFQEAFDRFGEKGLEVLAINIGMKETQATAKKFASEKHLTLPLYFDADQRISKAFKVSATPGVLLLDREGNVVSRGHEIDLDAIEALLAGKPIPKTQSNPGPAGSGSHGR